MDMRSMWSPRLTTFMIALIPVAVAVNYVGKAIAAALKLPLWLDSIGTVLAAMLGGPVVGALSGAINNIFYGLTADPVSFWYAITSLFIGMAAGYFAYKGWVQSTGRAIALGVVVAIVSAIVSTPINVVLWQGTTGNTWGDALFTALRVDGVPVWLASFLDEFVVDLPDKVITVFVAYLVFRGLPQRLVAQAGAGARRVQGGR
ncbi:MAG: ECF transporter S component [Clostridia bacterium]|nr:ECF transporter S component [Clostridia bacterium]